MTVKEYLNQIRALDKKIDQRIEEAAELRQIAFGIRSPDLSGDRVQTSPDPDKRSELVHKYIVLENRINELIDQYVDMKNKIIGEIHALPDMRLSELLYLRYVKYMRIEEIACTMKKTNGDAYSYQHILRLHGKALKCFGKKYGNAIAML